MLPLVARQTSVIRAWQQEFVCVWQQASPCLLANPDIMLPLEVAGRSEVKAVAVIAGPPDRSMAALQTMRLRLRVHSRGGDNIEVEVPLG